MFLGFSSLKAPPAEALVSQRDPIQTSAFLSSVKPRYLLGLAEVLFVSYKITVFPTVLRIYKNLGTDPSGST